MKMLLLFSLTIVMCSFSKNAVGLDTVTLLPMLCGTTAMPAGCQIILAHNGVSMGVSGYPTVTINCSYVILAAMPNQRIRFGIGTGEDEVNVIMHDNGCTGAAMQVIDSDGTTVLATLCDGVLSRDEYLSSGDRLTLSVFTMGGNSSILNFTAHYTSFTEDSSCRSDPNFFPCDNGRCIDPAGRCDTTLINNCGDFSDNSRGPPGNCSSEEQTTATSVTTDETTAAAATTPTATDTDSIWIAGAVVGGLLGTYLLYWLLWRPGYLVWRCSCWRHWCRSYPTETKNPDDLVDLTQPNGSTVDSASSGHIETSTIWPD